MHHLGTYTKGTWMCALLCGLWNAGKNGKGEKRQSVASAPALEKTISEPIFPISCKCVFSHSHWKFLSLPNCRIYLWKSLLPLLNLCFHGQHGLWITKPLQAFVYTHTHEIKISPFSAHTQATTLTFQDNNQVSLLTRPSLLCHFNLWDWTLFTCSFIEFIVALQLGWNLVWKGFFVVVFFH